MSFTPGNQSNERTFQNADSFSMAFDNAWKNCAAQKDKSQNSQEEKLKIVLETINDHPFLKAFPKEALEIAKFRIRLLNLN